VNNIVVMVYENVLFKDGKRCRRLMRVFLLVKVIFNDSRLSITGLNFLAKLLVINLRI